MANGLNAYHPLLLSLRGERVAIVDGSTFVVAENGETTIVESDLLTEYPILKGWDETQMKFYQLSEGSHILVGKSATQAVLLLVSDDAAEGVTIKKIADLPMTLPDDESVQLGYYGEATRVFCDNVRRKLYVQTIVKDDSYSPVIVEYACPSPSKPEGGSIVVYATDKPLEQKPDNGAWTMLADGTLVAAGGGTSNYAAHTAAYIFSLQATRKVGDVNGDNEVGIGDIVAITNVMADNSVDEATLKAADVNNDGEVGIGDIVAITNIMAGIQ